MKTLSIITINRNNVDGLKKTMDSVMSQNCTDYEYIIIDGASTDGSKELIQQYAENPLFKDLITYWISEPDTGIYNAMNKGIDIATGEYCLFLNSGDWFVDNTKVKLISEAAYQEDIIYFDALLVYNDKITRKFYPTELDKFFFLEHHTVNHQNTLIKTSLQKENLYSEQFKYASDAYFFIQMILIEKKSTKHISDVVTFFEAENGLSINPKTRIENFKEWYTICLNFFPEKLLADHMLLHDFKFGYCGILNRLRKILLPIRTIILKVMNKSLNEIYF